MGAGIRPALHARRGLNPGAAAMPGGSAAMGPAEAFTAPESLMGEDRLHVVFGTGQVGHALAAVLAGRGLTVRVVSRHRPPELAEGIDWRAADATDPDAAGDAAKGAAVVYQCLNAPYTQWPERFPPLQRGVLAAAERGGALLVTLENLYGYGPASGRSSVIGLPPVGRVRVAIGRASDFFGPGVTAGS